MQIVVYCRILWSHYSRLIWLKKRRKNTKKRKNRIIYDNAFERVFIEIMIESQRLKKKQRAQKILNKKEISHTRNFVVVVKRQIIADNKIKRAAARAIKKTTKNEKIDWKHWIKRRIKRKKKKKLKMDVNSASQKNLSASQQNLFAFQFSNVLIDFETNVYSDSNESASTEAYFDMFNSQSIEWKCFKMRSENKSEMKCVQKWNATTKCVFTNMKFDTIFSIWHF